MYDCFYSEAFCKDTLCNAQVLVLCPMIKINFVAQQFVEVF